MSKNTASTATKNRPKINESLLARKKTDVAPRQLLSISILVIILLTVAAIATYEFLVEQNQANLAHLLEIAFVAVILLAIVPPLLYFFSYRPLLINIAELQESEKNFGLLAKALASADDGVVITDARGTILWSNPAYARMNHLSPEDMPGRRIPLGDMKETVREPWQESFDISADPGNGRIRERMITPVRDENEVVTHFILLEKDITEQQALSQHLVKIQEKERQHIARELHDEAGQSLATLKVQLQLMENTIDQPEAVLAGLQDIQRQIDTVSENLHRLAVNLRPAVLDYLGLVPAVSQLVDTISQNFKINGEVAAINLEDRLPNEVETAVYRIVQEALTNVIRHAQATQVDVLLKLDRDVLLVIIEDNGIGFDTAVMKNNTPDRTHLGLLGMRERVEILGGTLTLENNHGKGSTVKIEVPHVNTRLHNR